ncbi:MAG: MAPEG family protein [Caulobacteraceae bacterium]
MNQDLIFAPMGALALLTFAVLLLVPTLRFRAAFAGQVTAEDFRLGESAAVPPYVSIPNRNYMNLLELPILFFPACLMFYVTHRVDGAALGLAWAFVGLRAVHSAIHLTYNNVFHRLTAFALGNVALAALWLMFFVRRG